MVNSSNSHKIKPLAEQPVRRRFSLPLIVFGAMYIVWMFWLAYVAWVNISAGNQ